MRTISDKLAKRLALQTKEAEIQGFEKVANNLKEVENPVRKNGEFYRYSKNELLSDLEKNLWNSIIRIADFHDCDFDVVKAQQLVDITAQELLSEMRILGNVPHGIGAHEPQVPGEDRYYIELEVDE